MTTQQIYNTVNRHTYEINQLQSQTEGGISLTSAGGTETLVNDGTGPTLATKGLSAGTGVTLASDSNSVTINATTTTLTSAGGTETLVNDGTGPTLATKGLSAGTGVTLASDSNSVTINATTTTLTSAGGTETLVNDGTGPTLATKGLSAGNGITLTSDSNSITINTSGGIGNVVGPNSSVTDSIAIFNSTTGKSISNSELFLGTVTGLPTIRPFNSNGIRILSHDLSVGLVLNSVNDASLTGNEISLVAGAGGFNMNIPGSITPYSSVRINSSNNNIYYDTSSRRYKENITDLSSDEYDKIDLIRPVTYTSKHKSDDPNTIHIGIIAEELYELFPNLVPLNEDKLPESIVYDKLSVLLIGYCKKIKQELVNQKQEYNNLRSEFEAFKNK